MLLLGGCETCLRLEDGVVALEAEGNERGAVLNRREQATSARIRSNQNVNISVAKGVWCVQKHCLIAGRCLAWKTRRVVENGASPSRDITLTCHFITGYIHTSLLQHDEH